MREKTTNGQVIIVYTEHPVFGILLIPYIAERLEAVSYTHLTLPTIA